MFPAYCITNQRGGASSSHHVSHTQAKPYRTHQPPHLPPHNPLPQERTRSIQHHLLGVKYQQRQTPPSHPYPTQTQITDNGTRRAHPTPYFHLCNASGKTLEEPPFLLWTTERGLIKAAQSTNTPTHIPLPLRRTRVASDTSSTEK
jgi:hypothetical protein